MKSIYFIESNQIKYYKTDTFWSKSIDYRNAKEHDDSKDNQERFLESLLFLPNNSEKTEDLLNKTIKFYNNSIYGYQTLDNDNNILDTFYLKLIEFNGSEFISIDYKQILRDNKINKILKNG